MAYEVTKYPEYAGSSAIAGKQFLLYIAYDGKWQLVGGCRTNSIEISTDSIDASDKSTGGWGSTLPGTKSWTSSLEIVMKTNNETLKAMEEWVFNDDLQAQRPALHFCFVNKVEDEFYSSWATIGNYSIEGAHDDVMMVNCDIQGVTAIVCGEGFVADTTDGGTINPVLTA